MSAAILDFEVEQGATFEHQLTWLDRDGNPVPLDGYTARMQVREKITSEEVLVELTTENGMITLGGQDGTIDIEIPDEVTETFTWKKGVYDLELESPAGKVTRLVKGKVTVDPEVTR